VGFATGSKEKYQGKTVIREVIITVLVPNSSA
jgi:hypothetical protein